MNFTHIKNAIALPVNVERVHIVDCDNVSPLMQFSFIDQKNTVILGALYGHSDGVIKNWTNFAKKLNHASFRMVVFSGETIPDMGDHLVSFLAARWVSLNPSMATADWNIHTNDAFGRCLSLIMKAFGVSARVVHTCEAHALKEIILDDSKEFQIPDFTKGMTLGAVSNTIAAMGGKQAIFNCSKSTKLTDLLVGCGYKVKNNRVFRA